MVRVGLEQLLGTFGDVDRAAEIFPIGVQPAGGEDLGLVGRAVVLQRRHHDARADGWEGSLRDREDLAELVIGHLPDKTAGTAKCCHARNGVGRRSAAGFHSGTHFGVKRIGTRCVHQLHAALGQAKLGNQCFFGRGKNIDNGIANGDYIKNRFGHGRPLSKEVIPRLTALCGMGKR